MKKVFGKSKFFSVFLLIILAMVMMIGCSEQDKQEEMILATTTSTYDSGLLHYLLPIFEEEYNINVHIISVGTGQAIETGRRGDCDIILVHARNLEDEFVEDRYGSDRYDVMYNDFIYLGIEDDPAEIYESGNIKEALETMVDHMKDEGLEFVSRGDNSGTHNKEFSLWPLIGIDEPGDESWYMSVGQGMGDTLVTANEIRGYTLTDRGTYLSMKDNLPNLEIVFEGDEELANPYGIIPVNPETHSHVKYDEAMLMVEFFTSDKVQEKISEFGIDEYGQPLFFPNAK